MKRNVNELKGKLLNKEMSFILLDSIMSTNGYYSELYDGMVKYFKNNLFAVYCAVDTGEAEIAIKFEITRNNEPDEIEESFYLKVLDMRVY